MLEQGTPVVVRCVLRPPSRDAGRPQLTEARRLAEGSPYSAEDIAAESRDQLGPLPVPSQSRRGGGARIKHNTARAEATAQPLPTNGLRPRSCKRTRLPTPSLESGMLEPRTAPQIGRDQGFDIMGIPSRAAAPARPANWLCTAGWIFSRGSRWGSEWPSGYLSGGWSESLCKGA